MGPEVLEATMPWGLKPPPGQAVFSLCMDGVGLAMVIREASGRRGHGGGGGGGVGVGGRRGYRPGATCDDVRGRGGEGG